MRKEEPPDRRPSTWRQNEKGVTVNPNPTTKITPSTVLLGAHRRRRELQFRLELAEMRGDRAEIFRLLGQIRDADRARLQLFNQSNGRKERV